MHLATAVREEGVLVVMETMWASPVGVRWVSPGLSWGRSFSLLSVDCSGCPFPLLWLELLSEEEEEEEKRKERVVEKRRRCPCP